MGTDKLKKILFKGDKIVWIVFITLCAISWVEVFSATSRQTYQVESYWSPIIKHSAFLVGGIFVVWFIHNMRMPWIKKFTFGIYWLGLAGLIWAQFDPSSQINDSARWINIFGLTFQPMEFSKMGIVMVTALFLAQNQEDGGTKDTALKPILLYCIPPILIILKENLSSAALLIVTLYMMLFIARIPRYQRWRLLGICAAIGAIGLTVVMLTPDSAAEDEGLGQKIVTWKHRIENAVKGSNGISAEDFDSGDDQMVYSKIAIASSHILGCGPGNSIQRDYIPHAYSDYIYAVIIEELGLLGGFAVLMLYITLLYRCGKVARRCEDPYPAFLVMGIGLIIVMQAMMHMTISVSTFVTGQPLPLLSQGGTSVIINSIYIGFILCISRYANKVSNKTTEVEKNEN